MAHDTTRSPRYGIIDLDYAARLATTPPEDDGPIWMVNLMSYRDQADYAGHGDPEDAPQRTGREADDEYAPVEVLAAIGAEIVFVGDVDAQLLGDSPQWHRIAVVKYPSRRSFIEMQTRDDFRAKHVHKEAGMASTIVMGCTEAELPTAPSPFTDWSQVPHPPTPEDGPVAVLHVIKYSDDGGREQMTQYQNKAFAQAGPAGVRIGGWFDVEGTVIGDGRAWDQVRFNLFPSKAAFMAVALDPDRLAAQAEHREPAMTDTYALIVRPTINRLPGADPNSAVVSG